jgi:hypothetical protein
MMMGRARLRDVLHGIANRLLTRLAALQLDGRYGIFLRRQPFDFTGDPEIVGIQHKEGRKIEIAADADAGLAGIDRTQRRDQAHVARPTPGKPIMVPMPLPEIRTFRYAGLGSHAPRQCRRASNR